jgi:hypothetical protein
MKIVKRDLARPIPTATVWAIPTMSYLIQKSVGVPMNDLEYLWWLTIPSLFVLWMAINYKIVK